MHTIKKLVDSHHFQNFIMAIILINGLTMGFEVSSFYNIQYEYSFHIFNLFVISLFTIEIIMRISVYKLNFFKDPWSLFDLSIVLISLAPTAGGFEIFRILRVLRLFRLITIVPQMRNIVTALLKVIPGIASIGALLTLFFYIFAIMSTQLYGEKFPQWFGTLGESFYTLFQIMTLESWSMGIVRPVMEIYPLAWVFFVPFIFIATFIIVNLIIAIVVDAMNEMKEENNLENLTTFNDADIKVEVIQLQNEIKELKELIRAIRK